MSWIEISAQHAGRYRVVGEQKFAANGRPCNNYRVTSFIIRDDGIVSDDGGSEGLTSWDEYCEEFRFYLSQARRDSNQDISIWPTPSL